MIYILSDSIRSGKTTALKSWSENRMNIGGFLSPDAVGKRKLFNLHTKEEITFEVESSDDRKLVPIGKFNFLSEAFKKAEKWVLEHHTQTDIEYIVIDEVGKLELKNEGFHGLMINLLASKINQHLIIVVRASLLEAIIEKYKLEDATIIKKEYLKNL